MWNADCCLVFFSPSCVFLLVVLLTVITLRTIILCTNFFGRVIVLSCRYLFKLEMYTETLVAFFFFLVNYPSLLIDVTKICKRHPSFWEGNYPILHLIISLMLFEFLRAI